MKVSREQAAQNRDRIVEAAAQLFRERGFELIGVADSHEGGRPHAWRFLRTLLLEGGPDCRGVCPRADALACALEQACGACAT